MAKPKVKEVIVVEGRYDKNTLSQVVDAVIVELGGFAVFNDKEKQAFLRKLAKERGIILFTDPDGAGFVIRNRVKGNIPEGRVLQAYVPDIYGKEKRKRKGGKEGKLGVEGMKPEILLDALRRAGATIDEKSTVKGKSITKADLYDLGLIGPDSVEKRKALCKRLELPEHLSTNALVEVLNLLMSREELENKIATLTGGRAAEEVVFHSITTGASNDIEQATKLARAMLTRYGMSDEFDMVALETVNNQYLGGDTSLACSAQTQCEIDQKVVELVKAQHAKAVQILTDNRAKLDELAQYLYQKETITGDEFMEILNREK